MTSNSPMISTIVAIPTMISAFWNASWLSRLNAASPVTFIDKPLPASTGRPASRTFWTTLATSGS